MAQVAPQPQADFLNLRIELEILDITVPRASGRTVLTLKPWDAPLPSLTLDAKAMHIVAVECEGHTTTFKHANDKLVISFSPPLPGDETSDIITTYELDDPPLGLNFNASAAGRAAQIHSQGETDDNSYWFPCHDYPNDRLTTELVVTAPADCVVSSNGVLISRERRVLTVPLSGGAGGAEIRPFEVWHWKQSKPHVSYLVSLVVGKYEVVDVGTPQLAMPVYVPPGRAGDVQRTYGRTQEMVAAFEKAFDEPYPWDRYAQVLVWNFGAGGMENTGCTTLTENAIISESDRDDHNYEGLIAHELGHQWFGDLITCKTWGDIWLNEGFATYCEPIWAEARVGVSGEPKDWSGRLGYEREVLGNFQSVIDNDNGTAPSDQGMASEVFRHPDDVFDRKANPYPKGSAVLHMLRRKLGDEAFFNGLRSYVDQYKLGLASTGDFQRVMEEAGGIDLKLFFDQWVRRPGIPRVNVKLEWLRSERALKVSAEQTQTIDAQNPAFVIEVPVWMRDASGRATRSRVEMKGQKVAAMIPLEEEPVFVCVDPDLAELAEWKVTAPTPWLIEQLRSAPTLPARVQAAKALSADTSDEGAEALRRTVIDTDESITLRTECVRVLAKRNAYEDIQSISTSVRDRWEVREAVSGALADVALSDQYKSDPAPRKHAVEVLLRRAKRDESLKVRAASIRALARLKPVEAEPLFLDMLKVDSHNDELRKAALESLADIDAAAALSPAAAIARSSPINRTRTRAIRTVASLAHFQKDQAMLLLGATIKDRAASVRMVSAEALADIGDERGILLLESAVRNERAITQRQNIAEQLAKLEKKVHKPADASTPAAADPAASTAPENATPPGGQ